MTELLRRPAYERAVHYLRHEARPLEKALYEFHFENGRRTNVLAALVPYQNHDGGFGHALEPDLRAPASSVIATVTALAVLRQIGADEDTPGLPAALAYLMDAYDVTSHRAAGSGRRAPRAVVDVCRRGREFSRLLGQPAGGGHRLPATVQPPGPHGVSDWGAARRH